MRISHQVKFETSGDVTSSLLPPGGEISVLPL